MMHQSKVRGLELGTLLLIWLAGVLLWTAAANAGDSAADQPGSGPGSGELELRCSTGRIAVPAVHTDVRLDVTGPLIHATVRQDFTNPATESVSGRYVFPLPEGAAVSAMELQVGERRIVSVVKEKEAARIVYEKARKEGRKAALVSSARRNLFVTEVANVGPGESVSVRLEYLDQVAYEDGWFSLALPLTFTPRYFPPAGGETTGADVPIDPDAVIRNALFVRAGDRAFPQANIEVLLTPGLELADVLCPSHPVAILQDGETWRIGPTEREIPADRDFLLRWRPVRDPLARPLLFTEETADGLYALLMVVPGDPDPAAVRPATDTVFVLDVSGSMGGPSIRQARTALIAAIGELREGDRFTVMAFDDRTRTWSNGLQPVDAASRQSARDWVRRREARGGTQMHPALLRARLLIGQPAGDGPRPGVARQIILLTDAAVGNEDQLLRETVAGMQDIRLHVVGIGPSPNRHLVRRLAGEGGGQNLFVAGFEGDSARLTAFLERIGRPQWSDPRLEWYGPSEVEGYPSRLPAPVPGQLLLWSGLFAAGTDLRGVLRANGIAGGLEIPLGAASAPAGSGLATRWARLRVDDLLADYDSGGDRDELRDAVVVTALAHGLVTRFTSRVAVELAPAVAGDAPVRDVPSGLPRGSQLLGPLPAGGTLDRLLRILGLGSLLIGTAVLTANRRRMIR